MPINNALILGAGLGTRMGEIGKSLPKILWPIYFKTMLELQIRYCEDLGVKNIYLNSHHLHDDIWSYLKTSGLINKITLLHEKILLDSGGAIHNLAIRPEINYQGDLLLINGDQFFFFDRSYLLQALKKLPSVRAVLFGIKVPNGSSYNEVVVEQEKLIKIEKPKNNLKEYVTYSGVGLLNLNGLKPIPGVSRFFETVANYQKESILITTPDQFEYWDFGTSDIYAKNLFKLQSESEAEKKAESAMMNFLKKQAALTGDKNNFINISKKSIDLECQGHFVENSLAKKDIIQRI